LVPQQSYSTVPNSNEELKKNNNSWKKKKKIIINFINFFKFINNFLWNYFKFKKN
jgi:hypothetical protein